jgi:hypothetical protein
MKIEMDMRIWVYRDIDTNKMFQLNILSDALGL